MLVQLNLKKLPLHAKIEVARWAENVEVLCTLAKDLEEAVRGEVAKNPNTDRETLQELTQDSVHFVRETAKRTLHKKEKKARHETW